MQLFEGLEQPVGKPWLMQGWFPEQASALSLRFVQTGGLGVLRLPAFPELNEVEGMLQGCKGAGLDLKGLRDRFREVVDSAKRQGAAFLAHGPSPCEGLRDALKNCTLPRFAFVKHLHEAEDCARNGADVLVVEGGADEKERIQKIHARTGLPLLVESHGDMAEAQALLALPGVKGLQLRSPKLFFAEVENQITQSSTYQALSKTPLDILGLGKKPLPALKLGSVTLDPPLIQGGMGIGISWEQLAGAVAKCGCAGIISAIGTGYHNLDKVETLQGRPLGAENLHDIDSLTRIIQEATRLSEGKGAVGVNILCAIQGYERMVRASVQAGARIIISGAGLPLSLPDYVGDADVALIPIVSSPRALAIICKTWQRKFNRLPDGVVLEGPESGGHQGFSFEQCADPAFTLEKLLPEVVLERDKWGSFPVIVAGGVWDREDIDRFMALGAGGVQMATRFIGTLECDADMAFKEVVLKANAEDIRLVKSPVGMPGRAVCGDLQENIVQGKAPKVCCISDCVSPCERGKGAQVAGYCIADRLADARQGLRETGLFFTGSNGWKLKELVSVRELVSEITQQF